MRPTSCSVALPAWSLSKAAVIWPEPSLHGGHWPQDSTARNRENERATSTTQAVSS